MLTIIKNATTAQGNSPYFIPFIGQQLKVILSYKLTGMTSTLRIIYSPETI